MKKALFIAIPAVIILAGYIFMGVIADSKPDPPRKQPEMRPRFVETMKVEPKDIHARITAYGRIASRQPVELIAETNGTLQKGSVSFLPGQLFRKGDVLVRIDDRETRLNLNSAKSDFMNALATVLPEIKTDYPQEFGEWQSYFDRCGFDKALPELPETENRRIRLYLSRYNVYKLYFAVRELEITLEKHSILAPFNGSIEETDLREGAAVRQGNRLGRIINLDAMEVEALVPSGELQWIDRSQAVTLSSSEYEGRWTGSIVRIGTNIDLQTQSVAVYIRVNAGGRPLLNGSFLKAEIPGRRISDAVTLPQKAIYEDSYVFVIADQTLQKRNVSVLRIESDTAIVQRGLKHGDSLVIESLQGVVPGSPAQPRKQAKRNNQ